MLRKCNLEFLKEFSGGNESEVYVWFIPEPKVYFVAPSLLKLREKGLLGLATKIMPYQLTGQILYD